MLRSPLHTMLSLNEESNIVTQSGTGQREAILPEGNIVSRSAVTSPEVTRKPPRPVSPIVNPTKLSFVSTSFDDDKDDVKRQQQVKSISEALTPSGEHSSALNVVSPESYESPPRKAPHVGEVDETKSPANVQQQRLSPPKHSVQQTIVKAGDVPRYMRPTKAAEMHHMAPEIQEKNLVSHAKRTSSDKVVADQTKLASKKTGIKELPGYLKPTQAQIALENALGVETPPAKPLVQASSQSSTNSPGYMKPTTALLQKLDPVGVEGLPERAFDSFEQPLTRSGISATSFGRESGISPPKPAYKARPRSAERTRPITHPVPPKFHEIHRKPRVKSSEEIELEIIAEYKKNPFRANPVLMNDLEHRYHKATRPIEAPKLTVPQPFHFHSADRAAMREQLNRNADENKGSNQDGQIPLKKHEMIDLEECKKQFKARPMPNFESSVPTIKTARKHVMNCSKPGESLGDNEVTDDLKPKQLKIPADKPFHFRTQERHEAYQLELQLALAREKEEGKKLSVFRARPMPNLTTATRIQFKKKDNQLELQLARAREEEEQKKLTVFRARELPKPTTMKVQYKNKYNPSIAPESGKAAITGVTKTSSSTKNILSNIPAKQRRQHRTSNPHLNIVNSGKTSATTSASTILNQASLIPKYSHNVASIKLEFSPATATATPKSDGETQLTKHNEKNEEEIVFGDTFADLLPSPEMVGLSEGNSMSAHVMQPTCLFSTSSSEDVIVQQKAKIEQEVNTSIDYEAPAPLLNFLTAAANATEAATEGVDTTCPEQDATALDAEQDATALDAEQGATVKQTEQDATAVAAEQDATAVDAEQDATEVDAELGASAVDAEQDATAVNAEQGETAVNAEQNTNDLLSLTTGTKTGIIASAVGNEGTRAEEAVEKKGGWPSGILSKLRSGKQIVGQE